MIQDAPVRRRIGVGVVVTAVAAIAGLLAACTSSTSGQGKGDAPGAGGSTTSASSVAGTPTSSAPPAVAIHVPQRNIASFNPAQPVTVTAEHGTLTGVSLTNPDGVAVTGAYSADKTSWTTTEDLGYSKTYQLSVNAVDASGTASHRAEAITTVSPSNLTMPYLDDIYGSALVNGGTYGVGMIPVVHFDEHITDKAAAEKALSVTVKTPGGHTIPGVWAWLDDQNVHWRAQNYLLPGSTVTVTAKVYGVQVGDGLYGQQDKSVTYKIGRLHVSVADDTTHQVTVYWDAVGPNHVARTMPTSMGQGGYVTGDHGQQIPLWTMPGVYTVLGFENPATMSSDSYGLPANSPKGYAPEKVYWSTKISTDGIYLHQLDATVWAQGSRDLSHGCLNLNYDNAKWFFQNSLVGDIVEVKNVHSVDGQQSAPVAWWQGGDWSVPWSTWVSNSALH